MKSEKRGVVWGVRSEATKRCEYHGFGEKLTAHTVLTSLSLSRRSLASTNRLKFFATILTASSFVVISQVTAYYFIRSVEPTHLVADNTGDGCEGCADTVFKIGEGGSIFDPFMIY